MKIIIQLALEVIMRAVVPIIGMLGKRKHRVDSS